MGMTGEQFPRISKSELALCRLQTQVLNSLYQTPLQGTVVVVFNILDRVVVFMNTNTIIIPCRAAHGGIHLETRIHARILFCFVFQFRQGKRNKTRFCVYLKIKDVSSTSYIAGAGVNGEGIGKAKNLRK